jgi:tetratricopeptide (TPR) repeat protein
VRSHRRLSATLAVLLLAVSNPLAATTVKGFILENEMGGRPLNNVRVSAIGADPVSLSLLDGRFVLELPNKQPGEMVQLFVQKSGMAVVNYFELRFNLPKDANAEPLILLLSKEDERQEMLRRYYRLDRFDPIEQSYREKLKDLQAKNQATEAAKEQLRIERDRARAAELHTAEELARVKVVEVSEFYAHPTSYYRSDAAMALNSLGVMYCRQNRVKEARQAFDKALEISQKLAQQNRETYLPDVEETWNNLGNMLSDQLSDQNRKQVTQDAQEAYDNALKIGRELVGQKRGTYLPSLASTLNNLGTFFHKLNRLDDACNEFPEALKWYRELERQNSTTYRPRVVETLNNLGSIYQDLNLTSDARIAFSEALNIYEILARQNPGQYVQEIESAYDHVLDTNRKLADQNPTYQREVAATLNNLGTFLRLHNRMKEAGQCYDEALAIDRELAQENLGTYLPAVAGSLNNIEVLNRDQNRMPEARIALLEALAVEALAICETLSGEERLEKYAPEVQSTYESLEISRTLAQEGAATYLPKIAIMLINLGNSSRKLDRHQDGKEQARKAFSKALTIYETLAETNPELYGKKIESTQKLLDDLDNLAKGKANTDIPATRQQVTVKLVIVLKSDICKGRIYISDDNDCPVTRGMVSNLEETTKSFSDAYPLSEDKSVALTLNRKFHGQLSVVTKEYAVLLEFDLGTKEVSTVDMLRDSAGLLPDKFKPRHSVTGGHWYTHQNAADFEPGKNRWILIKDGKWYGFYVKPAK